MEDVGVNSRMGYSCTQVLSADNKSNTYLWFNSLFSISSFATTNGVDDVGAVGMGYSHLHPACSRPNVSPYQGSSSNTQWWPFMYLQCISCMYMYTTVLHSLNSPLPRHFVFILLSLRLFFRLMSCSYKVPYITLLQASERARARCEDQG